MLVLDSSIVIAWLLPDERDDAADAIFARFEDEVAVAPTLLRCEVANALLIANRRQRITELGRAEALAKFEEYTIRFEDIGPIQLRESVDLGVRYGLTVYDAAYLQCASAYRATLCTFDVVLLRAARGHGVDTAP